MLVGISCMFWSLMSLSPLTQLIGPFLTALLSRLGLPDWFKKTFFAYHSQVQISSWSG